MGLALGTGVLGDALAGLVGIAAAAARLLNAAVAGVPLCDVVAANWASGLDEL